MPMTFRAASFLSASVVLGCSLAGCVDISAGEARYVDTVEKRFAVSGTPTVRLGTFDGSVQVSTWDRPEVLVVIERHAADKADADRMRITAEQRGNDIDVDVRTERDGGLHLNFGSFGASVTVSVPARANVEARTGDGRVTISGVQGDLNARTGDGAIRLDHVDGAVDASSGDGSIEIDGTIRNLRVRSGDGRVRVRTAGPRPSSDWSLVTGDGSVVLEVPDGFGAELDASTGDGRVSVRDVPFTGGSSEHNRRVARGRIGAGGPTVTIRSGDGAITIQKSGAAES